MYERLLRLINSEGMAGPAFIMLVATVVGGACNFLYMLLMANSIPADYAELKALLAILYIMTVPALAIQNVLIRFVSKYKALDRDDAISWLIRRLLVLVSVGGAFLSVFLFILFLTPEVSSALKLTDTAGVLILSVTIFVSLLGPVGMGPLQGLQQFTYFGIQSLGSYLLRLVVGMILVLLGLGLAGALGGVLVGAVFGTGFSIYIIRKYFVTPGTAVETKEIWWFTMPALMGVLCYTVLTNIDVVLAQILMGNVEATIYAAASSLATIILFLPTAVSAVMFPKVARVHAENGNTNRLLNTAFMMAFIPSVLFVSVYLLFPNLVLHILLPKMASLHAQITPVLQVLSFAMMLLGLANMFMLYGLATDGHAYIITMGLSILVLGLLVGFALLLNLSFTAELLSTMMAATGLLSLALSGIYLILIEREWRPRAANNL